MVGSFLAEQGLAILLYDRLVDHCFIPSESECTFPLFFLYEQMVVLAYHTSLMLCGEDMATGHKQSSKCMILGLY